MNVIETEHITKRFKTLTALDNISIQVREGEIYGFLGLNGAGKTTLIRILLGMIKPRNGTVTLFGRKLDKKFELWNNIGYLVETPYSYPNLSVSENLAVYHALRQLQDKHEIANIIEKLNLSRYAHTKANHLSLGNAQRLGLAKALMHRPKLLILDEPVNGLDPEGIIEVRELLQTLAKDGTTIFLSSHILGEISKLADRIAIIHQGKLLEELNGEELSGRLMKKLLVKTGENGRAVKYLCNENYNAVVNGDEIEITGQKAITKPEEISRLLVEKGLPVKQIYLFTEDLEHYFIRTVEGTANA
jgi:ABC-2 type transport system ATP-binding protein